ncbi:hypothetical protein GCM10010123_25370 [Pilimelia anulata]|uniref:DUF4352 domain-containing protein n=1 Tax=Pilimelia anulata TaxID=53371 RepID=A0A8J3BCH6_9ACTN|nr:hypothetical protein [Pilimelia anulata]GGJ94434.1 hypothetical protein GCM10010123_25370 [Pilimelia anulata]
MSELPPPAPPPGPPPSSVPPPPAVPPAPWPVPPPAGGRHRRTVIIVVVAAVLSLCCLDTAGGVGLAYFTVRRQYAALVEPPLSNPGPVHPHCAVSPATYPGQDHADDYCADRSGRVILRSVHLTAAAASAPAGTLCAVVAYRSMHDRPLPVALDDWELRSPAGTVLPRRGGTLRAGPLAPGATLTGTVCFAGAAGTGRYVLSCDPTGWDRFRGVWFLRR